MATFDSPLEALAFQYASFGVFSAVNNLWTWLLTATVSLWRIKVTTTNISHGQECGGSLEELSTGPKYEIEPETTTGLVKESVRQTEVCETLTCGYGVTKGKLTMYYYNEVDVDGERCRDDGELTSVSDGGGSDECCEEWWERWERVVRMKNGEDGWYRYVDLTVINGNVVRLWDDDKGIRNGGGKFLN